MEDFLQQLTAGSTGMSPTAILGYSAPASIFRKSFNTGFRSFILPRTNLEILDMYDDIKCGHYESNCTIPQTLPNHQIRPRHIPNKPPINKFYDFIVPRYFKEGDCVGLAEVNKLNSIKYTEYQQIYDDFEWEYNLDIEFSSDLSSIEGIVNSFPENYDQEKYTYNLVGADSNFQQYWKKSIIPGFSVDDARLDYLNLDNMTNFACQKQIYDQNFQVFRFSEFSGFQNKELPHMNVFSPQFVLYHDEYEKYLGKYQNLFAKINETCSVQLSDEKFRDDFIESSSGLIFGSESWILHMLVMVLLSCFIW